MEPHVIIVDDDPSILTLLRAALKAGAGARVTSFASAEAALDAWDALDAPALLLTDYSMPGMNGLQLATAVRARAPTLPILMLSAVEVPAGPATVVTRSLIKPCPPRVLLPAVRELLGLPPLLPNASPPAGSPARQPLLTGKYRGHLAKVLLELPALVAGASTPEGERALRDQLHQLSGTAGSYGFMEVTEAAVALRGAVVAKAPLDDSARALARALEEASRR